MALRVSPLPSPRPQFPISAFLQRRGPLIRVHLVPPRHAEPHVLHISVCVAFAHPRIVRPLPLGVGPFLFSTPCISSIDRSRLQGVVP